MSDWRTKADEDITADDIAAMRAAGQRVNVFDTPGGRSYLRSLMSLNPSPEVLAAVEKVRRQEHGALTGEVSRRVHGMGNILREREASAAKAASAATDEREAAALRGKATAYREAIMLTRALEAGWNLPRNRRWRRRKGHR
jgi:hypothetical protein